ncbi:hypothetical protein, partial [Haloferula sp. A504]|uniref:hypothetical protein n=1 Tax=Haloferula sp. A504 TaxID=3373601 RepID=UPI0031BD5C15|nr:hypothetical protein [Verrucomicrobiaceae bacterium E54]
AERPASFLRFPEPVSFRAPFCGASHGVGDVVSGEGDLEFVGVTPAALGLEADCGVAFLKAV